MGLLADARQHEIDQKRSVSTDTLVAFTFGRVIGWTARTVWSWRISLLWLILAAVLGNAWGWWGVALVVALVAGSFYFPHVEGVRFGVADARRSRTKREALKALADGNAWLREVRLVSPADEALYDCVLVHGEDETVVELGTAIRGVTSMAVVEAGRDFQDRFNAVSLKVEELGGGSLRLVFRMTDPMAEGRVISAPAALDPEKMAVICGVDDEGEEFSLSFREVSGTCVSGIAGSGKTAGVSTFMLPLSLSEDVHFSIIDGKGGTDWAAYQGVAESFISVGGEAEDYAKVHSLIMSFRDEMNARLASQKERLGQSNFWNSDLQTRRNAGLKFRFLVIDEAQEVFNFMASDKETKQMVSEVTAALTSIVKRGRSAGVSVLFITQKMTADAIPTAIRDNCSTRLSFRLMSPEAERAVLGDSGDDLNAPRPTAIPKENRGQAVILRDTGERGMVRFFYMPETEIEAFLGGASS